jgi:hypothetical protein
MIQIMYTAVAENMNDKSSREFRFRCSPRDQVLAARRACQMMKDCEVLRSLSWGPRENRAQINYPWPFVL